MEPHREHLGESAHEESAVEPQAHGIHASHVAVAAVAAVAVADADAVAATAAAAARAAAVDPRVEEKCRPTAVRGEEQPPKSGRGGGMRSACGVPVARMVPVARGKSLAEQQPRSDGSEEHRRRVHGRFGGRGGRLVRENCLNEREEHCVA